MENSVWALSIVGALSLVVAATFVARAADSWHTRHKIGIGLAGLIVVGTPAWLLLDRSSFDQRAHYTAATLLFACIVAVVFLDALRLQARSAGPRARRGFVHSPIAMG